VTDGWMIFEKVAWTIMTLMLTAGLAGMLGRGPLSKGTARAGSDMEVRYERIARNKTPAVVEVKLNGVPASGKTVRVRLEGDLFARGHISRIVPQPKAWKPVRNGAELEFASLGSIPAAIGIVQEPASPGHLWNRITVEGGSSVTFNQIVLP
jgi:hypothetical protein